MLKWTGIAFLLFFTHALYSEPLPLLDLPQEFTVKPMASSLVPTFYFESNQFSLGKVVKEITPQCEIFHYIDDKQKEIAIGKVRFSSKGNSTIELYSNNTFLGSIQRETHALLPAKYTLYDKDKKAIAVSEMNWLGSRFSLLHPKNFNHQYALFTRPFFKLLNDLWYVKIVDIHGVDPRFIIMIAAFQTDLNTKNNELGKG